ncbi:hypothetical protein [Anaeroselena agilis]|uniref:Uncharacterized protein n=1 Tax=Anaeroselena agilis TaxID=3063788 RepID=A0ABU3P0I5_9FIRM|nr:hypothetical protein [Selenomonadales bacterium 4137-cl]
MKSIRSRVLTKFFVMAFIIFGLSACAAAAPSTRTLDEDTLITPPGVIAAHGDWGIKFKKGTVVTLNENGEVLEGTLASSVRLPCVAGGPFYYTWIPYGGIELKPNRLLDFKAGTRVTFNGKGEVIKGTVTGNFIEIPVSQTDYIRLSDNTEVSFHENGMIATCTLNYKTYLRPVGWRQIMNVNNTSTELLPGLVQFRKETRLVLNDKCEVIKGTLNKDTKLLSPSGYIKVYEAGTTVEFDDKGVVVKAAKS